MKYKLERVYRSSYSKFAAEPDGKQLTGYNYRGYYIDITEDRRPYSMFGTKKWYTTILKNGEKRCSDILREVKDIINNDINS